MTTERAGIRLRGRITTSYYTRMKQKIAPLHAATIHAVAQAGGPSALARAIGIAPAAVSRWLRKGRVPPLRVLAVEAASGVSRKALRPDLYP